jgi:hypothetical protein
MTTFVSTEVIVSSATNEQKCPSGTGRKNGKQMIYFLCVFSIGEIIKYG